MARDLDELLDKYMDENKLYRTEGRKGVENICQLARALGYRDPQYFGQLSSKAAIGDLVCMLEDNPGMLEAMFEWVRMAACPDFKAALEEEVGQEEDEEEEV